MLVLFSHQLYNVHNKRCTFVLYSISKSICAGLIAWNFFVIIPYFLSHIFNNFTLVSTIVSKYNMCRVFSATVRLYRVWSLALLPSLYARKKCIKKWNELAKKRPKMLCINVKWKNLLKLQCNAFYAVRNCCLASLCPASPLLLLLPVGNHRPPSSAFIHYHHVSNYD